MTSHMKPRSWFLLVALAAAPACTAATQPPQAGVTTRQETTRPVSPGTSSPGSTPAATATVCSGDDERNQDDDGARVALLQRSDLPGGAWSQATTPPCPWALSADEILLVPACLDAAKDAAAPANDEARNGNARVTFAGPGGIHLDHRVEIFTSRQNVDAIRAILAGPSTSACYEAAVADRAKAEPGSAVTHVRVTRFAVRPDAAAMGLGFPAVAGYAADAGFAEGVDVAFTRSSGGSSQPVALRIVTFGGGGLMSTLTLIGSTAAELDAIDLPRVLEAAATRYRAMLGPGS